VAPGLDRNTFHTARDELGRLPVLATFVVDRNGMVVKAHVEVDDTTRLEPSEIVVAVQ